MDDRNRQILMTYILKKNYYNFLAKANNNLPETHL